MIDEAAAARARVKDFMAFTGGYVCLDAPEVSNVDENLIHFRGWLLEEDSPITFSVNGKDVYFVARCSRLDAEAYHTDLSPIGFEFWLDLAGYLAPESRALHIVARCGRGVVGEWHRRAARQRNRPAPALTYMIHIPKTAGTAIRSRIERASNCLATLYVYDTSPFLPVMQLPLLSKQALEQYDLVYGHFPFGSHGDLKDRPFNYVTILRDPTKYIASMYLFYKYTANEHSYKNIRDFIDDAPLNTIDNKFCRMLTATPDDQVVTEITLQTAKNNIDKHFSYVGLHEELSESLKRISALIGVDLISGLTRENTSDGYDESRLIDMSELRSATERFTRHDRALYAYVESKFFRDHAALSTPRALSDEPFAPVNASSVDVQAKPKVDQNRVRLNDVAKTAE
jgi:hypothetical protein